MDRAAAGRPSSPGARRNGVLAAAVVALSAMFVSEHYGAPAMLMALLLGLALNFLHEDDAARPGIEFSASAVLRVGVALLGLRVSWQLLAGLGVQAVLVVLSGAALTIAFGCLASRLMGRGANFGLLTGGSVAICGASAAMAIAAVLPRNERSDRNLAFTVVSVTVLGAIAMVVHPVVADMLALDPGDAGLFLGGTIHDVAQVVGAGYSVSEEAGDASAVVKLLRVSLLAPLIAALSLAMRARRPDRAAGARPAPVLPAFVIAFFVLAAVNSTVPVPDAVTGLVSDVSRFLLLVAIAAIGMKTSPGRIREVGGQAIVLVVAETLFLTALVLGYVLWP